MLGPADLSDLVDGHPSVQLRDRPSSVPPRLERGVTLMRVRNGYQLHSPEGAPQLPPRVTKLAGVSHLVLPRVALPEQLAQQGTVVDLTNALPAVSRLVHTEPDVPDEEIDRVLVRYRLARLAHLDRATGRVVRCYERAAPGEMVHVDIKRLGNIPDGGGHKVLGRADGKRNRRRGAGYGFMHNAVDDHSRLAYTEILPDERKQTRSSVLGPRRGLVRRLRHRSDRTRAHRPEDELLPLRCFRRSRNSQSWPGTAVPSGEPSSRTSTSVWIDP